jgi:hypothetical protein
MQRFQRRIKPPNSPFHPERNRGILRLACDCSPKGLSTARPSCERAVPVEMTSWWCCVQRLQSGNRNLCCGAKHYRPRFPRSVTPSEAEGPCVAVLLHTAGVCPSKVQPRIRAVWANFFCRMRAARMKPF